MAGKIPQINPLSGKPTHNRGGVALGAGNVNTSSKNLTNVLSLSTNAYHPPFAKNRVFQAVSPNDSGNLGTTKPFSAGKWNSMEAKYYITFGYMQRLYSTNNTLLNNPAQLAPKVRGYNSRGNYQYNITSWDYVTGAATKGVSAGVLFNYTDGFGNTVTQEAFPTDAVPGKLVYLVSGKVPTQSNYGPRHNS